MLYLLNNFELFTKLIKVIKDFLIQFMKTKILVSLISLKDIQLYNWNQNFNQMELKQYYYLTLNNLIFVKASATFLVK